MVTVNDLLQDRQDSKEEKCLPVPSLETLMRWEMQAGCEARCVEHCWVESDGYCPHGKPSWLIVLGLI